MAEVLRYVNTASTAGGDGTTNNTTGATRAYASLSEAEAAEQADFVTATDNLVIKCSGTTVDGTGATIDGSITSAIYDITIQTDSALSNSLHNGAWDTSAYRIEAAVNFAGVLSVRDDHVNLYGLQLSQTGTGGGNRGMDYRNGGELQVAGCIIRANSAANVAGIDLDFGAADKEIYIWNNIIYDWDSYGINQSYSGVVFTGAIYNNTVYGCGTGILFQESAANNAVYLKNNLCNGNTTDYSLANMEGTATNLSEDATSPESALRNLAVTFVNEGSRDLHLDSSDTSAIDAGTDLSADGTLSFSDDIDEETRSGTWDIGADEYVAAGGVSPKNRTLQGPFGGPFNGPF